MFSFFFLPKIMFSFRPYLNQSCSYGNVFFLTRDLYIHIEAPNLLDTPINKKGADSFFYLSIYLFERDDNHSRVTPSLLNITLIPRSNSMTRTCWIVDD